MTAGGAKTRADRQRAKREPASTKKGRPKPDLAILQTQVFRGPNYWSYEPCIRMLVDLGSLEEWPSNTIPRFNERLLELLPGVGEHSCSLGKRGGFRERLTDGTWLGHVAEHVALELQRESGAHISRGKTRSAGASGQYNVIYGYAEEYVGLEAGRLAVRLVNHLVKAEPEFDFPAELERLILLAERRQFGPSTQAILDEAASRDIPFIRLNEQSLVQLGQGKYQQRIRADDDVADERPRRGHRRRQEDDELAPRLGRPAGPEERGRPHGGRRRRRREADRVPGGDEAARRQPRARGRAGHPDGARGAHGVQARGEGVAQRQGRGRELRDRQRLPGAGDRRADGGDRATGARARDRRRQAHGRASSSRSRTRIRGAASVTRRCSRASRWTTPRSIW